MATKKSNKFNLNQLYVIGGIAAVILLLILIIWPFFNYGNITINSQESSLNISICQSSKNQTTGFPDIYTCFGNNYDISKTINNTDSEKLKPGFYYLLAEKEGFQKYQTNFTISRWQETKLDIKLLSLSRKINNDYTLTLSGNNNQLHYLRESVYIDEQKNDQKKYEIVSLENDQSTVVMEITNITDPTDFKWSPDNQKLILTAAPKNNSQASPQKYFIDITNKKIIPSSIPNDKFAWSTNSQKIYYVYTDLKQDPNSQPPDNLSKYAPYTPPIIEGPNHNTLTIANPDGSDWKSIIKLDKQISNPTLFVSPDNQYIAILDSYQKLFLFNINSQEIKPINSEKNITYLSWSPDSSKILLETIDEANQPEIIYYTLSEQKLNSLKISSFIIKTNWLNNNQLAIAIPVTIPDNYIGLPVTNDRFFIVNFDQPSAADVFPFKTELYNLTDPTASGVFDLSYNSTDKSLYFIDQDHYLYTLTRE